MNHLEFPLRKKKYFEIGKKTILTGFFTFFFSFQAVEQRVVIPSMFKEVYEKMTTGSYLIIHLRLADI